MITALLYNSCTSCRKTEAVLKESGVEFEKREYFKNRLTRDELASLLNSVGLTATDVLSTRSRPYREMGLAEKTLSDEELLDLMIEEPRLLRRPLVIRDGAAVVGHNEAKLRELIDGTN